jgi:hypothetical protein
MLLTTRTCEAITEVYLNLKVSISKFKLFPLLLLAQIAKM